MNRQKRLSVTGLLVLLVGLGVSIGIYSTDTLEPEPDSIYEFQHSKKYQRDLQLYGGDLNVLMDKWYRSVASFCQGKYLAFTVAVLALLISGAFFAVAHRSRPVPTVRGGAAKDGN